MNAFEAGIEEGMEKAALGKRPGVGLASVPAGVKRVIDKGKMEAAKQRLFSETKKRKDTLLGMRPGKR